MHQGMTETVGTLNCMHDQQILLIHGGGGSLDMLEKSHENSDIPTYPKEIHDFIRENNSDAPHQQDLLQLDDGTARSLAASHHGAASHLTKTVTKMDENYIVRRLTPTECERLQGFPDDWTLIGEPEENPKTGVIEYWYTDTTGKRKKVSDSARYKSLGNSIGLPYWRHLARRIVAQYEGEVTLGSLFDGISGFPLVFKQCGANPLWSSEIEEFPIAVCKQHFGDEDAGITGDYQKYL